MSKEGLVVEGSRGLCPCCVPTRERKQYCCFSGRGRRGSIDELETGRLPRLADHAKVLTLPPPHSSHSYPEAGTKPHESELPFTALSLQKDSTPLGEGEERDSTNPLLEITIQQRSSGCESLQAP